MEVIFRRARTIVTTPAAKVVIGILMYLGLTASYMAPVLPNCAERFVGVPGDQTAFAWLYNASPDSPPLWGATTWTNAPYGENLYEPMHITGLVPYTATWVMSRFMPAECGFNVLMSFGFVLTSVVTFLFILWLTKRKSYIAAWFGGFLVAFTPYLLAKTPYHVSYVYCGLLVGLLWLLLALWKKYSYKLAAALMLLTALIFYHDPYFIQLSIVVYTSFFAGLALYVWREKAPWRQYGVFLKQIIYMSPIFLALISPMIYTRVAYNDQINTAVKNSRDTDVIQEGLVYGARPWEYVFPSTYNPLLPDKLKEFKLSHQHGSNPAETTLYLGVVPLGLSAWFIVTHIRGRFKKRDRSMVVNTELVIWVVSSLIVISGLLSLLPRASILGMELHFPSELLLNLTSMWRVPARLVVLVQIGLGILSALALIDIMARLRGRRVVRALLLVTIVGISFVEYLSYNPFDRSYWGYDRIPGVYAAIKQDGDIARIAEYPLVDPPRDYAFIYYLTYQSYHQKQMLNSAKVNSLQKALRESIADLTDWQTPGALKQLGVDRVLTHGSNKVISDTALVETARDRDQVAGNDIVAYRLANSVVPKPYILQIGDGFDGPSNFGFERIDFYMHGKGVLMPTRLADAAQHGHMTARLEYYGFNETPFGVVFSQDNTVLATATLTSTKQIIELTINTSKPLVINVTDATGDNTLVVSNMELY